MGRKVEGSGQASSMQCMEIRGGIGAVEAAVATPGLDVWVYSKPHAGSIGGGDVHYVSLCGGGITTRLILADVSGHGDVVADLAGSLRSLMRRNINSKSQTRLVRSLNRQFSALGEMSRFATAIVATYLASRRRLTLCNAGHPRPLWFSVASGEWTIMTERSAAPSEGASNLPLGMDDESPYDQFAVALSKGDVVVFYTDALTEATDGANGPLGEQGLLAIARSLDLSEPRTLGRELLDRVADYRGGKPDDDDVTVLTLHHNAGRPPRLTIGQKLDVYAKVFGMKKV